MILYTKTVMASGDGEKTTTTTEDTPSATVAPCTTHKVCSVDEALPELLKQGRLTDAKNLLKFGDISDVDQVDVDTGGSALYWAAYWGYVQLVEWLLLLGGDPRATNRWQQSILHVAVDQGRHDITSLLLDWGADINAVTQLGDTACHLAVCRGHTSLVKLLIRSGSDVTLTNTAGKTAYDEALAAGNKELAQILEDHKASLQKSSTPPKLSLKRLYKCAAKTGDIDQKQKQKQNLINEQVHKSLPKQNCKESDFRLDRCVIREITPVTDSLSLECNIANLVTPKPFSDKCGYQEKTMPV